MKVTDTELGDLRNFIESLNSEINGILVVEGKRDSKALKKLGYCGNICEFHSFKGLTKFADAMEAYSELIILLDSDKRGKYYTARIIEQLGHRVKINLFFRKRLTQITRGKITHVEELSLYLPFFKDQWFFSVAYDKNL